MKQSTSEQGLPTGRPSGIHLAIIMDGNGRWATQRRRARTFGHRQGAEAVRRVVKAAPGLGIGVLTLYAFSSDNWSRPPAEVRALMRLLHRHLLQEAAELADEGVRLRVIGRRDRLSPAILHAIRATEERTRAGERLLLRVRGRLLRQIGHRCGGRGARSRWYLRRPRARPSLLRAPVGACLGRAGPRPRRGPPHPHGWRTAPERLPPVGVRVRRAVLQRSHVARVRWGRLSPPRSPISAAESADSEGFPGSRPQSELASGGKRCPVTANSLVRRAGGAPRWLTVSFKAARGRTSSRGTPT